jgi:hypothetical protein
MNEMKELDQIKTGAVTWTIQVDRHGWFYADAPGFTQISGDSLAKVEAQCKVKASQSRIKVSVPYVRFGRLTGDRGYRAVHGEATGIHAGNGKVLTREDGRPGEPLSGYSSDGIYPPMDAADEARVVEIRNQEVALAAERSVILAKYKWGGHYDGIKDAVQKAVDEAAAGLGQDKGEGS